MSRINKLKIFLLCPLILGVVCSCPYAYSLSRQGEKENRSGTARAFAQLRLRLPNTEHELDYLGLPSDKPTFSLAQIKAEVLILEIVSTYCPYCEGEVSELNRIYEIVGSSPYTHKIKFIGIGMANSDAEVEIFRERQSIPFPLFADRKNEIYKVLGRIKTPYWVVLKSNGQGGWKEIYSRSEKLPQPEAFLEIILPLIQPAR